MNYSESLQNVSRILNRICSDEPAIQSAYLFGSVVCPNDRAPKDIDIALLLDDSKSDQFELPAFISLVENRLSDKVDVIILNRAGEVVKFEVRRSGKLIFERSPEIRKKFEVKGRKTYEDFLYLHNRYANKVLCGR